MAAKAQDNRFQNLTIDYHKVMTLTPTKRVEMADTTEGRSLLTSLTPQQLQTAFPYQYGRDDPTGEKLRSITTGKAQQPQAGDKPELSESTRERLGGNRGRSDPGARAQLTKEQKEVFDLLQKGEIAVDDPRVGFLKQISDDDLKKFGINKTSAEGGKQSFKMDPTKASQMSDEELKSEAVQGKHRPVYKLGEADLSDAVINTIAGEARLGDPKGVDAVIHNMMNRVGTSGWGPSGNLKDVARAPGQYAGYRQPTAAQAEMIRNRIKEISTGNVPDPTNGANEFRATSYVKGAGAGKDFDRRQQKYGGTDVGGNTFAYNPSVKPGPYAPHSQTGRTGIMAGQDPSAEDIQNARSRLSRQELEERQAGLAGIVTRQQQASAADVRVNRKSDTQAKVYYAGDSIGVGVGTQAGGIKLAQSGLKFTDPSILQQLAKVPKGSTVELHGGTNDAVAGITDPDVYREQMKRIAELAKANGITVNVNGPPKTKKNWDPNAEAADSAMAAAAQEHGVSYRSLRQYTPPDKSDGVHFDNKGYQAMVRPLQAPEQQAQAQTETVPNMADGGEMQTDADQLQVYALDKNKLQRDDSIALDGDGKPQFTMNSKESMKFDPNTGKVEVDNGAKGLKNDPNKLGPEQQQTQSEKNIEERNVPIQTQPVQPLPTSTPDNGSHNSMNESVILTENIFKSPSFERAVARTRFQNTGDATLGGHFDGGAYGMV